MRAAWLVFLVGCGGASGSAAQAPSAASSAAAPSASASSAAPEASSSTASAAPAASRPAGPSPVSAGTVFIGAIDGTPGFDPRSTLEGARDDLLGCYGQARAGHPALHGKVTLRIVVNEAGRAVSVESNPGGSANDPGLVACIGSVLRGKVTFQKQRGSATVIAPLVFHSPAN